VAACYKLTDPGSSFPADALVATPARGRTVAMQIHRERLERRVARLEKLHELRAPEQVIIDDQKLMMQALLGLIETGWNRRRDPLPANVTKAISSALDMLETELDRKK